MSLLSVDLLGAFQVSEDGKPVQGFRSDKARALFAFLCTESSVPHRREKLAGLFWPEISETSARANLRFALANLRRLLDEHTQQAADHFLAATPQTIQLNTSDQIHVDVAAFTWLAGSLVPASQAGSDPLQWEGLVHLYRGEFLEGFSLPGCPAFEEWILLNRERFHRLEMDSLNLLTEHYQRSGLFERAIPHAFHQLELDPWQESAHRQLMKLLALSGRRAEAILQYETCRRVLKAEIGIKPDAETRQLYEQILQGSLKTAGQVLIQPARRVSLPAFLEVANATKPERQVFFARQNELARLGNYLDRALKGSGQVIFISGEAGSGKTALIEQFARRASEEHADLITARGACNGQTGIGDPYLPFREMLGLLAGDVESPLAARAVIQLQALRLWNNLAMLVPALLEHGRDLIETFLPGQALLERATFCLPDAEDWLVDLSGLVKRKSVLQGGHSLRQETLFEQFFLTLRAMAEKTPLLLLLDDLQWADQGSINLLLYLGKHLQDLPILLIGTFRSEEVSSGKAADLHPLLPVLHKFQQEFGEIVIDLDQADGRPFIEALIESEPNQLGKSFKDMLYIQTRGQPLFTIELLQGMQQRGDLVKDSQGMWVNGPALDWDTLPTRLEAAIAERLDRLSRQQLSLLRVASVEGELFTAEVGARVLKLDENETVSMLSGELDRGHRLVRAFGTTHINGQRQSCYRFRHILFQKYLYAGLDGIEREHLHEAVGSSLEALYDNPAEQFTEITSQLARHFQEAGLAARAAKYHYLAGERAVRLSANEEAIIHYNQGVKLLRTLPDTPENNQLELKIQVALAVPMNAARGYASTQLEAAVERATELARRLGGARELMTTLIQLFLANNMHGNNLAALGFAEQATALARENQEPLHEAIGIHAQGMALFCMGEFRRAQVYYQKTIDFYDPALYRNSAFTMGQDVGVAGLCWGGLCEWILGYPDRAANYCERALKLARDVGHRFTLTYAMVLAGSMFNQMKNDIPVACEWAGRSLEAANEGGFAFMQAYSEVGLGWAQVETGQINEGLALILSGLARQSTNAWIHCCVQYQALLARGYTLSGDLIAAIKAAEDGLALAAEYGERYYEAELRRLKGEILQAQGDPGGAEACFMDAIRLAQAQQAKSWELRASLSLARTWQDQGRGQEAFEMLSKILGWFREGFDTPDLKTARSLLIQRD